MEKPKRKVTFDAVRKNPSRAAEFVAQMSPEELARISVCCLGWVGEWKVLVRQVVCFRQKDMICRTFRWAMETADPIWTSKILGCRQAVQSVLRSIKRIIGSNRVCNRGRSEDIGHAAGSLPRHLYSQKSAKWTTAGIFFGRSMLSGVMAGFYAELEGAGGGGCYKHFIGNNCESSRKRNQSLISERAIREIYFRTFEYAMDVHMPASFMTAYNAVNGCPTAADEELLQGLLRERKWVCRFCNDGLDNLWQCRCGSNGTGGETAGLHRALMMIHIPVR